MSSVEYEPAVKRPRTRQQALSEQRNVHFDGDKPSMDTLNDDSLLVVFKCLDLKTRCRLQRVSKQWQRVFLRSMKLITVYDEDKLNLGLHWRVEIEENWPREGWQDIVAILKNLKSIEDFKINWPKMTRKKIDQIHGCCPDVICMQFATDDFTSQALESLGQFRCLQELDICTGGKWWKLGKEDVGKKEACLQNAFSRLKNLKRLVFRINWISGTCLAGINRSALESLEMHQCSFSANGLDAFMSAEWSALTVLELTSTCAATEVGFMKQLVPRIPNVTRLTIFRCSSLTSQMQCLAQLKHLESLVLLYSSLVSQDVHLISKLVGLKILRLSLDRYRGENLVVESSFLALAKSCRKLETLELRGYDTLSNACLFAFGRHCANLSVFSCIDSRNVTNEGVEALVGALAANQMRVEGQQLKIFAMNSKVDPDSLQVGHPWVTVDVDHCMWT